MLHLTLSTGVYAFVLKSDPRADRCVLCALRTNGCGMDDTKSAMQAQLGVLRCGACDGIVGGTPRTHTWVKSANSPRNLGRKVSYG